MGIFDWVVFEDGIDVTVPELEVDVQDVTWQSKSIGRPEFRNRDVDPVFEHDPIEDSHDRYRR